MPVLFAGDLDPEMKLRNLFYGLIILSILLTACLPVEESSQPTFVAPTPSPEPQVTPIPTRTANAPGELVDYVAQSGDTLSALAAHFNTTEDEILEANPTLTADITTLPPGLPLRIPAYYQPLTGSPFHIIPDSELVNGPSAADFDVREAVQSSPGYLSSNTDYVNKEQRPAWEVVEIIARDYSVHPRILLALLEYQTGALTNPFPEGNEIIYPMGYEDELHEGLYWQLQWAAELLSDGYYGWRTGTLREVELADGRLTRPDPWQNAGTVGIHNFFAAFYGLDEFESTVSPDGFVKTYQSLWGDPFEYEVEFMPANLQQPELTLPFEPNRIWDYSAGPHGSWGKSLPLGALDFAPPAVEGGCSSSEEWVAAPAAGLVVRSEDAAVVLDLDGDGDERTGWILFFFHVAAEGRVVEGSELQVGDFIGHPSCEGGRATGTHFHIARRFNGEWLPAGGELPFILDGWVADYGEEPYLGTLTKGSIVVTACTCTTSDNRIIYEFP